MANGKNRKLRRFILVKILTITAIGLFIYPEYAARRDFKKTFGVPFSDASAQQAVDRKLRSFFAECEDDLARQRDLSDAKQRPEEGRTPKRGFDENNNPVRRSVIVGEINRMVSERIRLTLEIDREKALARRFGLQVYPDEYYSSET